MKTCAQCGKRHPKIRTVVLDKWLWVEGDGTEADRDTWRRYAMESHGHAQRGDVVKVSGRFFFRAVRAGGATIRVVVGVVSRREPWHLAAEVVV